MTLAAGMLTVNLLMTVPVSASLSELVRRCGTAVVYLSVLALAAWGFYTSLAGQRLWQGDLFE